MCCQRYKLGRSLATGSMTCQPQPTTVNEAYMPTQLLLTWIFRGCLRAKEETTYEVYVFPNISSFPCRGSQFFDSAPRGFGLAYDTSVRYSTKMASYLGTYLIAPLVKEALSSAGITTAMGLQLQDTLGNAQRTLLTAEDMASQIRSLLANPGCGLSGQPTIPRGDFTQVCYFNNHLLYNVLAPFDC
ncbi:hypothetical protein BGX38DRAFT_1169550 [Terfezia claveryi]|nr:hypothetical protein BGX38DRAFT_1169550 [Terfezia claveryi]